MADIKLDSSEFGGSLPGWDPTASQSSSWSPFTWSIMGVHLISWPVAIAGGFVLLTTSIVVFSPCPISTTPSLTPSKIIYRRVKAFKNPSRKPRDPRQQAHLLIVLGSGGHTAELLSMIRNLNPDRYTYRTYLISDTDQFSAQKAHDFEREIRRKLGEETPRPITNAYGRVCRDPDQGNYIPPDLDSEFSLGYRIVKAPRARAIHQSLLSTPISCLKCFWTCLRRLKPAEIPCPRTFAITLDERLHDTETKLCAVPVSRGVKAEIEKLRTDGIPDKREWQVGVSHTHKIGVPDVVLTNGPATGLIAVLAAWWMKLWYGTALEGKLHNIYVESFARVSGLSLSGKIIDRLGLADKFLVQWEKGLPSKGREEREVDVDGGVTRRKGRREWRGFLVE